MSKTLELIFDFGSPNAYLSMAVLPALLERTGATLAITPCLLGGIFKATGNKAPMVQYAEAPAKLAYEHLEMRRFIERHGLGAFRMNPHFPVNTLTIMRGAIVAGEDGRRVLDGVTGILQRRRHGRRERRLVVHDQDRRVRRRCRRRGAGTGPRLGRRREPRA